MKYVARSLASGLVVYVLAAACGASERAAFNAADGGPVAVTDALIDGIAHPVGEASAEPLPPQVDTEPCDKIRKYAGSDWYVAEHVYSGKSSSDLMLVRAALSTAALDGYTHQQASAFVADGKAAVLCQLEQSGQPTSTVTFTLSR